VNIISKRNSTP